MISIDFLRPPKGVDGLEFLDFQNNNFANELTTLLDEHITNGVVDEECEKELLTIIEKYTGFNNITVKWRSDTLYAVDTGYFSPKHVLNNQGIERYLPHTDTTLYRWFKKNKADVFKAGIDYSTGKVTGSFCSVPAELHIGKSIGSLVSNKHVAKYSSSLGEVLGAILAHELGHIFGACVMLFSTAYQNVLAASALRVYQQSPSVEDRVIVLKDVGKLLDLSKKDQDSKELEDIAKANSEDALMLYYSKLLTKSNQNKALSLGVPVMTSEVMADAYSMRMGFSKGIIAAVDSLVDSDIVKKVVIPWLVSILTSGTIWLVLLGLPIFWTFFVIWAIVGVPLFYFSPNYAGDYNSDPRRLDDLIRTGIMRLKESNDIHPREKLELVKDLTIALKQVEKIKPIYDNTVIERFVGYIVHGGDYKRMNIEHYAQQLANHELNLVTHQLANIKA